MSDNKQSTVEQIRGLISEVVETTMGEKFDEFAKANQEEVRKLRAEIAAQKREDETEKKGLKAARFLRHFAAAKGNRERAIDLANKAGDIGIAKAMEATDAQAGGVWVPEQLSSEVIELLRPASVIKSMGPRMVPMPTGSLSMTKLTGGATSTYIGESQNIEPTEQTTGKISLNWKKLACTLPISNDLLRFETFAGDEIIRVTGELFQRHCREQDIVTRYGGDEYAVVFWDPEGPRLAGSSHPGCAISVLERFTEALKTQRFPRLGPSGVGRLTISGGLATYPWDASTREDLVKRADEALLAAKRAGKNRIFLIGEQEPTPNAE